MLDKDQKDSLNRRDARSWFRGLGWCLHDSELDSMLDEVAPSSPHSPPSPSGGRWVLSQLLELSERHRQLCGPDPDSIRKALRDVVGGYSFVNKEHLRNEIAMCDVGMTEND